MNKKIISLSLISVFLIGTIGCEVNPNNKEVIQDVEEGESEYIIHRGKISEVLEDGDNFSIIVDEREILNEDDEPSRGAINFNITEETSLLSDKVEGPINKEKLVKGTVAEVTYRKDQPMTNSLPPMTNADIVTIKDVGENLEIESLNKIIHNGKEIKLENEIYESENTFMLPIREVGESLGYETLWNPQTNQVELTKGTNMVTTTLNEDMYSFSKMIVKLGKASEVKEGLTFVPVSFLDEVMQFDVDTTKNDVINIK